jgi:rhodanese-related sulfurtransferase
MKKIVSLLLTGSFALFADFQAVDADGLISLQKKGVPVIDIRRPEEWKERGIIKGAYPIMFFDSRGRPHHKEWLTKVSKLVKDKKSPLIIYCAHANRTKVVGKWLSKSIGYKKVYELKGGIEYGWIDKGKKTSPYPNR